MRIYILHIIVFCSLSLFLQCSDSNCFTTAGRDSYTKKTVAPFHTIQNQGVFNIELQQDTSNFIELSGGSNLIEECDVFVEDSILYCFNNSTCACFKNHEKTTLTIHFTNIDTLNIFEACSIYSNTPISNNLYISIQSLMIDMNLHINNSVCNLHTQAKTGGQITLYGKSNKCNLSANYTSNLNCSNLEVSNLTITNNSIMDFNVFATDTLQAKTTKTGKIYYSGNPKYTSITSPNNLVIPKL